MKKYSGILPLIVLTILAAAPCAVQAAQKGSLIGKIQDKDGQALFGAVIALFRYSDKEATVSFARSDPRGMFELEDIAPGSYALRVSRYGYQPLVKAGVTIDDGKTTSLNLILQGILDFISMDEDPRNWDLKTVVRSTSDRRLIFREFEEKKGTQPENAQGFVRAGVLKVASSSGLSGGNYSVFPSHGGNGIVSNFAFAEPLSENGQMIFAGQLASGYDSLWRVRNTFHYRPEHGRDMKFSLGYGRLNLNRVDLDAMSRPADFFSKDPSLRESGIQTVVLGFGASSEFLDTLSLEYGIDLSRIYYGVTKNVFSPYFQVVITPSGSWVFKSMMTSKRVTDNNSVVLPDQETVNLLEPAYIAKINGEIHVSQFKHSEISVARKLNDDSSLEVAIYEDHTEGPGAPFLMTIGSRGARHSRVAQLSQDQTGQHGLRVAFDRSISNSLSGSVTYVYGTGSEVDTEDSGMSSAYLADNLLRFIRNSYYHSITGQINTYIPQTQTNLTTIIRWYPGDPISPIDLFSDQLDTLTKGMSLCVRQAIPLPEFMGETGRWEALVDFRNLFDQGGDWVPTRDGEILLTRNPRALRFGLNLNLY